MFTSALFLSATVVQAQPTTTTQTQMVYLKNPVKATSLVDLLKAILDVVIKVFIPIISLALIYSGYMFISARGNTEKIETAKKGFVYSLAGAGILLGGWAITGIIHATITAITK